MLSSVKPKNPLPQDTISRLSDYFVKNSWFWGRRDGNTDTGNIPEFERNMDNARRRQQQRENKKDNGDRNGRNQKRQYNMPRDQSSSKNPRPLNY